MPRVFVRDTKALRGVNARMPQVQAALELRAEAIRLAADALFASHDHPGGHRIESGRGDVDRTVSLVGPAALSVEFGHFAGPRTEGADRTFVKGLHILSRAAGL